MVDLVLSCFDKLCPETFWVRAASRSGRYHPQLSAGNGGLVRHTKLAAWWGANNCRQFGSGYDAGPYYNEVVAALILHDMHKDGDPAQDEIRGIQRMPDGSVDRDNGNGKAWGDFINGGHGVDMAAAICNRVLNNVMNPTNTLVAMGVACHMGVWTTPAEYQPSAIADPVARHVALVVAQSDYCAAQKADEVMGGLAACVPSSETVSDPTFATAA